MAFFQYKAVTPAGEVQEGVLEAGSTQSAVARLQEMGLIPIRAEEAGAAKGATAAATGSGLRIPFLTRNRISQNDITIVTRELATLLKAGLPLDRSFEILINLAPSPRVAEMLGKIRNEVRGGAPLSKALDAQRGMFSRFYVNMIRAGEAGGSLPTVLLRLAEYLERAKALRDSVSASLVYPVILSIVSIFSVVFLLVGVVPRFKPIFAGTHKAVPLLTQVVLGAGDILQAYGFLILVAIAALLWMAGRRMQDPDVRYKVDRWVVSGRVVGSVFSRIEMARFSRTLGTLLSNGVTLVTALGIVRETMANSYLAESIGAVARELKEGRGLGKPMMESGRFPMLAVHMIQVGEETGRLDEMLMQVAETYDHEVDVAIRKALALLQPIVILVLAGVIFVIIMSILSAMLSIYDLPV